jgi:hypothetical protein
MHSGPNGGVTRVILDAQVQNRNSIELSNDGKLHQVEVWISERPEIEEKKLGGPVTDMKSDQPLNKSLLKPEFLQIECSINSQCLDWPYLQIISAKKSQSVQIWPILYNVKKYKKLN